MSTTYKSANVTKYDAGGSGDNVISDGYIKTVEKVWLDSYALTAAGIPTKSTIAIAKVPANKKITGIDVFIPATFASTAATIALGYEDGDGTTSATAFLAATAIAAQRKISANQGIQTVLANGENTIYATFDTAAVATTSGTIYTIVRYT